MARIRVLKVRGRVNYNKPKAMYFHEDNFDEGTSKKRSKYNVMMINRKQRDKFLNNQMRAYSDKIRFHSKRA